MPDQILLCGPYAQTVGLSDYLSTRLSTTCIPMSADLLNPKAADKIALDPEQLVSFFPFSMSTSPKGVDLLLNWKNNRKELINSIIASLLLVVLAGALMAITPLQMRDLQRQRDEAEALLQQPEYVAVQELLDARQAIRADQTRLEDAIAALVHSGSDMATMIQEVYDLTSTYGTVSAISLDYESETINLGFSTVSYDMVVDWQEAMTKDERYSFLTPPTFSGSGVTYSVSAQITCTDFTEEILSDGEKEAAE